MEKALVMSARTFIEKDPAYSTIAARLLMDGIRREALSYVYDSTRHASQAEMTDVYPDYFKHYIHRAIDHELLAPELAQYDLDRLGNALKPENDFNFTYLGIQTLYDRYFIHKDGTVLNYHKLSICELRWAWLSMKLTVKTVRLSSTTYCHLSTL